MKTDEEINQKIDKKFTNKDATVILYLLERRDPTNTMSLKQITSIFNNIQLEHIMPQKWEDNWKYNLPKIENAEKIRNDKIYTLGNMTILNGTLNDKIKNNNWKIKLNGKDGELGLKDCADNFKTFKCLKYNNVESSIVEIEDWNEKEIDKRTEWLFKKILEIWKID